MTRVRKSTMVELVTELEALHRAQGITHEVRMRLAVMIKEARAGEYHDYKNDKYTCGKVASSSMLREMGFIPLAKRIENGEFDEEADEQDKAMLRGDALAGGFSEAQCEKLFKV